MYAVVEGVRRLFGPAEVAAGGLLVFGIAGLVGSYGFEKLLPLGNFVLALYIACALHIVVVYGSLLLIPVQAWGICFQWLRDVVILSGPSGAAYLQYPRWVNDVVAYGYQFGFLMLTPVAPIMLWLMFNKRFVAALWLEAALDEAPQQRVQASTVDSRRS